MEIYNKDINKNTDMLLVFLLLYFIYLLQASFVWLNIANSHVGSQLLCCH